MEGIHFSSVSNDGFHFILFLQVGPQCSHMLRTLSGPLMSAVTYHFVKNEGHFPCCVRQNVLISIRYRGTESYVSKRLTRDPVTVGSQVVCLDALSSDLLQVSLSGVGADGQPSEGPDHRVTVDSRGSFNSHHEATLLPSCSRLWVFPLAVVICLHSRLLLSAVRQHTFVLTQFQLFKDPGSLCRASQACTYGTGWAALPSGGCWGCPCPAHIAVGSIRCCSEAQDRALLSPGGWLGLLAPGVFQCSPFLPHREPEMQSVL